MKVPVPYSASESVASEALRGEPVESRAVLLVDIDGYAGPLDVLLQLAQAQKVDLANISVLALCEQYLAFVQESEALHMELAADYLVMAAWLVYLKSRLLLAASAPPEEGESPEEMALQLKFRLLRLEAMRDRAEKLMERPLLGRDVFARGAPEPVVIDEAREYAVSLYDFLRAYGEYRARRDARPWFRPPLEVVSMEEARQMLQDALARWGSGEREWVEFRALLGECPFSPRSPRNSRLASAFGAALVLAREGELEFQQSHSFGALHVRRREVSGEQEQGAQEP